MSVRRGYFKQTSMIDANQNAEIADLLTRVGVVESGLGSKVGTSYVDSAISTAVAPLAATSYVDSAVSGLAATSYVDSAVFGLAATSYVDSTVSGLANISYVDSAVSGLASVSYVDSAVSGGLSGFASTSYVDSAVSGLASVSYVDSGLADKASSSDIATAVSGLASVSYVDSGLAGKADIANVAVVPALDQAMNVLVGAEGAMYVENVAGSGEQYVYDGTVKNLPYLISTVGISGAYWAETISVTVRDALDAHDKVVLNFDGTDFNLDLPVSSGTTGAFRKLKNASSVGTVHIKMNGSEGEYLDVAPEALAIWQYDGGASLWVRLS